jgi:hypothetical protein
LIPIRLIDFLAAISCSTCAFFDIAFSQSSCVIDVPFRIIYGLAVFMHPTFGSHLQTSNHGTPLKSAAAPKQILIVLWIKMIVETFG